MPIGLDVLRRFFRPQSPEDVTAMADLVIGCHQGDVAFSKQLIGDLPVERLLVPRFQESCHPCFQYTRGLEDMTNASLQRGR
ncbi:hypothetical protein SynRS9909_00230 [Synechococcus sp. RS9909]|nr:hypothetical protein SynRS9909_00230 [Synechococcus sp. RS9909]